MHKGKHQFEELCAHTATVQHVHSVQLQNHGDQRLTVCSYATDSQKALYLACPGGGATITVDKTLRQEANQLWWKAVTAHLQVADAFVLHAKRAEWTASTTTIVADKLQLQSSTDPFEVHSFSTARQALALRCPKGGLALTSGVGGILASTTGNVDVALDTDHTHLRLAARGHKKHTIHLGNDASETIVANQLTVKGKLVLSDDAVLERHVTTVRELQNVVRLACDDGVTPGVSTMGNPATPGFDYGFVAGPTGAQSGMVYDHQRDRFYFGARLGTYQHRRFALPQAYADVQAKAFLAQHKVSAPFVETTTVQCRSVRHPTEIAFQSPRVQCAQRLACTALHTDVVHAATQVTTPALTVKHGAAVGTLTADAVRATSAVVGNTLDLGKWLWNTVGPHGTHRTLQDFLDHEDEAPDAHKAAHAVFEATTDPHNCNATVERRTLLLDGRHGVLTGALELGADCERLTIVDAQLAQFTLASAAPATHPVSITLRNVHGQAKDWAFQLPQGHVTFEQCDVEFQNHVLGSLERVTTTHSTLRGTPWRRVVLRGGK